MDTTKTYRSCARLLGLALCAFSLALVLESSRAQTCVPPPAGLVLRWDFSDGAATDTSGFQNHGAVHGTPLFANGTVRFDNPMGEQQSTQWIEVPYSASIQALETNSFTFAIRYKSTDTTMQGGRLFNNYNQAGLVYSGGNEPCAFSFVASGGLGKMIPSTVTSTNPCLNTAQTTDGAYHWQILCVDRAQELASQYIDATHMATESLAGFGQINLNHLLLGTDPVYHWFGARETTVADLCIFNRSLSPEEVAAISAAGDAGICPTPKVLLIALYPGLTIGGSVGQTIGIQFSTDLSGTNSWHGLTNITLNTVPYLWHEGQPATGSQRFYRVVQGPIAIP